MSELSDQRTYDRLPMAFTASEAARLMDEQDAEVDRLRDLLTEAHRQDFGTPGWRQRVRRALDEEDRHGD